MPRKPKKIPPAPREKQKKLGGEFARGLAKMSQIAVTIVVCVLIGVFLGRFLDSFFGTSPWLLLTFSLMGAAAAFKYLIDLSKRM